MLEILESVAMNRASHAYFSSFFYYVCYSSIENAFARLLSTCLVWLTTACRWDSTIISHCKLDLHCRLALFFNCIVCCLLTDFVQIIPDASFSLLIRLCLLPSLPLTVTAATFVCFKFSGVGSRMMILLFLQHPTLVQEHNSIILIMIRVCCGQQPLASYLTRISSCWFPCLLYRIF